MTEATLAELREAIRQTDRELVSLLERRARISLQIGTLKKELGRDVYDPAQEARIFAYVAGVSQGVLSEAALRAIYREIISASRALQRSLTVSYLGPEASFSHLAAVRHFGAGASFAPAVAIATVFAEVEQGRAHLGIVPVENSLEGAVNVTLDGLIATPLSIRQEVYLRISQCLLAEKPELEGIDRVYSHPQALAQCREWLHHHLPGARLVEVESTATAARMVSQGGGGAAIGSRLAADVYGLAVIAEGIEDHRLNTTRFIVIGTGESDPTGQDKTSIIFGAAHLPGSLHHALAPFAERGVNLVKIQSHPVRERLWEYLFFVDFAGHVKDGKIRQCLEGLQQRATFVKVLGSYPQGEELR